MPKVGGSGADVLPMEEQIRGMLPSDVKKLKQLEEENTKLKKLVAGLCKRKVITDGLLSF